MRIHVLDMGQKKYGDCLVITHDGRTILIDGAHRGNSNNVRSQLKSVLDQNPPFEVDLLVITHSHDDHIGYLPDLVADGELKTKLVLAADEKLGWGRDADGDSPVDAKDLSQRQQALVAALLEEDRSDLPPAELAQFIQDAGTLEQRYGDMLEQLEQNGATIIRYGRDSMAKVQEIEAAFADFGLKVLGPTKNHLVKCAEAIAQHSDAIADAVASTDLSADAGPTELVRAYQRLTHRMIDDAEFAADQPGVGAAKNDQSIVLKVAADGWSALLAGDMQFAKAEVPGLNAMMIALRQKIVAAGPYDFIKLTHHTSYNALDASVLNEYAPTKLFAHTGGRNDSGHPDKGVLDLLESRQDHLTFARTDRNGRITVDKKQGVVTMTVSKGHLNDFSENQPPDEPQPPETEASRQKLKRSAASPVRFRAPGSDDMVEVIARLPHKLTKVTLTIQVEPGKQAIGQAPEEQFPPPQAPAVVLADIPDLRLGGGRAFPRLLFVTCRPQLETNIGRMESARVFKALSNRNVGVVDLPLGVGTAEQAARMVRAKLAAEPFVGVVILGGFDVVPAHRLDVLDAASRHALEAVGQDSDDADNFIVWSDEIYGDRDGDMMPELPVSRIPDGRRSDVVFSALTATSFSPARRFGVRNFHRPFANAVFPGLPGNGDTLEVSETFGPESVVPGSPAGAVYFMLHGSARDATRFWGETQGGAAFEAIAVENVPGEAAGSIVFTGCCWGALAMSPPAARVRPETPLRPRGPEASVAIAYLRAGALAFVGCTGSHYSPLMAPFDYFGRPLHEAFWAAISQGKPPAEALYLAKKEFARRIPHGRTDPFSRAVEVKILRQFTCLGLGW